MIDFKREISKMISEVTKVNSEELYGYIEIPQNTDFGDYAFPCFRLAKELKKAPPMIANDIKEQIVLDSKIVEKVEIVGGYLNFYVNKETYVQTVIKEIGTLQENYGKLNIGEGKNVVIDYSSPNVAKPFHIGHLRTTVIGRALYNIYQYLGYKVIGVNHLGDYGTQFGKLIEAYLRWSDEYNIDESPIDELTKMYVRINKLCEEDEEVLQKVRDNFKRLEDGDAEFVAIWQKFRDLSLKEFQRVYDLLGSKFDSYNGESFYSDKMAEVLDILGKSGKLIESEGAMVIGLDDLDMPPCIIEKSNGSTTYATRDLAAILYRARTYNYEKSIYVTSYEQVLHFKQVFETAKLLGIDAKYVDGLTHVPFGMVHLKSGKMSTREGNVVKLEDLLNEAVSRALEVIEEKNPNLDNKEEVAKRVGIGAVIFNDLANGRIKDEIFDWEQILNFNGETGPYLQYIYVRTKSVLEKAGYMPDVESVDVSKITDKESVEIIRNVYEFSDTLIQAAEKNEPSILSRYLIDLAQSFSKFYNEHHIITEDKQVQDARLYLNYIVGLILKNGTEILGMQMPERM